MNENTERRPSFGSTLRRFRIERKVSGVDLADHLGISAAYLHDVERDRRGPFPIDRIVRAAEFLGEPSRKRELLEAAAADQAIPFTVTTANGGEHALKAGVMLLLAWSSLTPAHFQKLEQEINSMMKPDHHQEDGMRKGVG